MRSPSFRTAFRRASSTWVFVASGAFAVTVTFVAACGDDTLPEAPAADAATPEAGAGDAGADVETPPVSCDAGGEAGTCVVSPITLEDPFSPVRFTSPVDLVERGGTYYVVEQAGLVRAFRAGDTRRRSSISRRASPPAARRGSSASRSTLRFLRRPTPGSRSRGSTTVRLPRASCSGPSSRATRRGTADVRSTRRARSSRSRSRSPSRTTTAGRSRSVRTASSTWGSGTAAAAVTRRATDRTPTPCSARCFAST